MSFRAFVAASFLILVSGYASGAAMAADPTCVPNAAAVKHACTTECIDDFLTTKFAVCKSLEPACVSAAVATKLSCIDDAKAPLQTCFDTCTDPDPLVAASCRDACRGAFYTNQTNLDALSACRSTFRNTVRACPKP